MSSRPSFVLRLARREFRSSLRTVGPYMVSIALGVAALVAIHGTRADVGRGIESQARELMGADVRVGGTRPLPDSLVRVLDSAAAPGARARVVTAASMVRAPAADRVRLLQVRGIGGAWPFYGEPATRPEGSWGRHLESGRVLVDPAALTQLGVGVGDTLVVGEAAFAIVGTVQDVPTDLGFQAALGPRVWMSEEDVEEAGLLGFGSLARYETFLALPDPGAAERLEERTRPTRQAVGASFTTAQEQADDLTRAAEVLGRFLGLVGLGGLLLGGVGVASAVHVFVKERLTTVAVLRCLGARQNGLFAAYLLQALALGALGAGGGAVLGMLLQLGMPSLLGGIVPVELRPRPHLPSLAVGLGVGMAVAVLFALLPLLEVRDVPPLRALRRDVEGPGSRWTPARLAALVALGGGTTVLCIAEAPSAGIGLFFAGTLAVCGLLLAGVARILMAGTRRFLPRGAPYPLRQGVSNLFRPRNQTVAVTLALGFAVFVVAFLLQVQGSLAGELTLEEGEGRPNLVLFDIQPDQEAGVLELLPPGAREETVLDPVVPARIQAIGGQPASQLLEGTSGEPPERWALTRTYRNTYRDSLAPGEEIVAGSWGWEGSPRDGDARAPGSREGPDGTIPISVEDDLAGDLGVGLGDRITWDVAGRTVETRVANLRSVEWERFGTNFFVVFPPGSLEGAPRSSVAVTRVADPEARAGFQNELVRNYPNVSVLDITRVQEVVEGILGTVDRTIRFLAFFAAGAGFLVLAGTLATSRTQRHAEGALLKTLGARRSLVLQVLLVEFLALGALASLTGLLLATAAAAAVVVTVFEAGFAPRPGVALAITAGVVALTVGVGLLGSRRLLSRPPLPVLRATTEA